MLQSVCRLPPGKRCEAVQSFPRGRPSGPPALDLRSGSAAAHVAAARCRKEPTSPPPGISLEQLKPELTLQRLDPLCERRLGQMQVLRGMSEMAGLGDFYESPELTQFHACSRLWADVGDALNLPREASLFLIYASRILIYEIGRASCRE